MRIDHSTLPACLQDASAAEAAVLEQMQEANQKRSEARRDAQQARADKQHEMRRVTKTLEQIASSKGLAGFWDFGCALGSAALEGMCDGKKAGVAAKLLEKSAALNPFGHRVDVLQARKSVHDARQERAAAAESEAREAAAEGKRLAEASLQRVEAMQRATHQGQLALLRG